MEQAVLHGIHTSPTHARITVTGQVALPALLRALADLAVPTGPLTHHPDGWAVTVPRVSAPFVAAALHTQRDHLGFTALSVEERLTEVAVTGAGLRSDPAIRPIFCEALLRIGVTLDLLTATGNRLAVLIPDHQTPAAVRALREALEIAVTTAQLVDDPSAYATVQVDRKSG